MNLSYTLAVCPFGRLLLAATPRGVAAIYLGDEDEPLLVALKKEYPTATLTHNENDLNAWVGELVRHLEGKQPQLDLPLDVEATAFQRRVWQALREIPYGSRRTYSQIAAAIGQPDAVRAVGRACATNPVSIVIPCHRVIREDGELGGYRWGLSRKQALLDSEAAPRPDTKD